MRHPAISSASRASSVFRLADGGQIAAVQELQELDGVFDVPDAASAGLQILRYVVRGFARYPSAGVLLHLPFERLHLVDFGEAEILPVDERLDRGEELAGQRGIAANVPQSLMSA